jgi:hypothetical protein
VSPSCLAPPVITSSYMPKRSYKAKEPGGSQQERCIYCSGSKITKKGVRKKKFEPVQLWYCKDCDAVFTPRALKGKTYPIPVILDPIMAARACIVESYVQNSEDYSEFRCGARTRTGRPCKRLPVPGGKRCPNHGGRSTGPRTPEGRARIAAAQRERWLKWRMQKLRDAPTQS